MFINKYETLVNFCARSPKFYMVVLKFRLVRDIRGRGFRGVRGGSCTRIAINQSIFELEARNFVW